jgi:two-component system response regulator FixJ
MPSDKAVVHVIDDDEAMRESLAFLLSAAGMEVRTYESAMAFLEVASKIKAGCVITDVRMPELSGLDLLRRLRELKLGIPVIVITGHGDVPLAVEAMQSCRTASVTCWGGSSAGKPTNRSPTTSASAHAQSRSIGRTS